MINKRSSKNEKKKNEGKILCAEMDVEDFIQVWTGFIDNTNSTYAIGCVLCHSAVRNSGSDLRFAPGHHGDSYSVVTPLAFFTFTLILYRCCSSDISFNHKFVMAQTFVCLRYFLIGGAIIVGVSAYFH